MFSEEELLVLIELIELDAEEAVASLGSWKGLEVREDEDADAAMS